MVKRLNWTIDRLCLREHYVEVTEIVGKAVFSKPRWHKREVECAEADRDVVENNMHKVYNFITSTQDLLKNRERVQLEILFSSRVQSGLNAKKQEDKLLTP